MASKREEQMAARYAEMSERNKQLEQQNAALHAEIEALRAKAVEKPNEQPEKQNAEDTPKTLRIKTTDGSSAAITKDDIRQIFAETLASHKEIIDKTDKTIKAADLNFRNACEFFNILGEQEHFNKFAYEVSVFRAYALKVIRSISGSCEKISEATTVKITPEYEQAVSNMADKAAKRIEAKLSDLADATISKIRKGTMCVVLSRGTASLFSFLWILATVFFVVSLIYNHIFLHAVGLFVIQYIFLGIAVLPLTIAWIMFVHEDCNKGK